MSKKTYFCLLFSAIVLFCLAIFIFLNTPIVPHSRYNTLLNQMFNLNTIF